MLKVVLDTNIIVSSLWTPIGNASTIMKLIFEDKIIPCFNQGILDEYRNVLLRKRLAFPVHQVDGLLSEITDRGLFIINKPSTITMIDETDRKFYDTAKFCDAYLITGNIKHFPNDQLIVSPRRFLDIFVM